MLSARFAEGTERPCLVPMCTWWFVDFVSSLWQVKQDMVMLVKMISLSHGRPNVNNLEF